MLHSNTCYIINNLRFKCLIIWNNQPQIDILLKNCLIFQQFLFHLSQISPRRNNITLKHKQKKNPNLNNEVVLSHNNIERLSDSLSEALRNFKSSPQIGILDVPVDAVISKKLPYILRTCDNLSKDDKTWKVSYVSSESFARNRGEPYGPMSSSSNNLNELIRSLCQQTKLG